MRRDKSAEKTPITSHLENGVLIFDKAPDPKSSEREDRERQEYKFLRLQARTNVVMAIFSGLLFLATIATIGIGIWQASISREASQASKISADAAMQSTYLACLTAQATQVTLAEIQSGSADAHASSLAVLEGAKAGIVANRAIVSFEARFPQPEEIFRDTLALPFVVRNDGKSDAFNIHVEANGVLLTPGEKLRFSPPKAVVLAAKRFPANYEYPETPKDPRFHAFTQTIPLQRSDGRIIKASSSEGRSFLSAGPEEAFVYGNLTYEDAFGKYRSKFCANQFVMNSGTTRQQSSNAKLCASYSIDEQSYPYLPKSANKVSEEHISIQPIACPKPKL